MTDADRDRCRLEQDRLIALCEELGFDLSLPFCSLPGAPTVARLLVAIYPEWLGAIVATANSLAYRAD
jgi:hypothetical protein